MNDFDSITGAACGLEDLYPLLRDRRFTAGWHKARPSLWREPMTPFASLLWKYRESARLVDLAGQWIDTELAERRNLLMFNPVGDNDYASLPTLVAAYQMIKPGEHARAHRHSPNALRLVLDAAADVYTVVDGVELPMFAGDIVLTPGGTWHSHYNRGSTHNAYWIDVLDVPLVHRLETMFFEPHPDHYQPVTERPSHSALRFSREDQLSLAPPNLPGHRRCSMSTPSLLTMSLALHTLAAGTGSVTRRVTANQVFAVIAGTGCVEIGGQELEWERGDVFVVPLWQAHVLRASKDARLLEVSDEPVHRVLGFFHETAPATAVQASSSTLRNHHG